MNSYSVVTVDMSEVDYNELVDLLRRCAVESDKCSELVDLAAEFCFFADLLECNRR